MTAGIELSPQQRRAWYLRDGKFGHDATALIRLAVMADPNRVRDAVLRAVAEQAVWRTRFVPVPGMRLPLAVTSAGPPQVQLTVCDLGGAALDEALADLVRAERAQPYDPSASLSLRVTVVRCGAGDSAVLLAAPVVLADATTLSRLAAAVAADAHGTAAAPDPAFTATYAKFADWQNELAETEPASLTGPDAETLVRSLGVALPGVAADAGPVEPVAVALDASDAAAVERLASSCSADATDVLAAAWRVLISRLAATPALAIGSVREVRPFNDLEATHGLLAEVVADVATLDLPSVEFADVVRDTASRAAARAAVVGRPLDWLAVAETASRGEAYLPVGFDVAPVFVPGAADTQIRVETDRFDVALAGVWNQHRPRVEIRSHTGRYGRNELAEIGARFATLLRAAVAQPSRAATRLDLLLPRERPQPPVRAFPALSLGELILDAALRRPYAVAVTDENSALSYLGLVRGAAALAAQLAHTGVRVDDAVGLYAERRAESLVGLLGIWLAGAAAVPVEPQWPHERAAAVLADASAAAIMAADDLPWECPLAVVPIRRRGTGATVPPAPDPRAAATVIYTSGSTGEPKGVVVPHEALAAYVRGLLDRHGNRPKTWAVASTLAADLAQTSLLAALSSGGRVHLVQPDAALTPDLFAEALRRGGVDALKILPSHLRSLLDGAGADVLPPELLVLGGEPLDRDLVEAIRRLRPELTVVNHYGPTETAVGVITGVPDGAGRPLLGAPLPHVSVTVVDDRSDPVPWHTVGELLVGGQSVTRGYRRPAQTAAAFVPDLLAFGGRAYRTGDRVRVANDGQLVFVGRVDNQVKVRGYRVELDEVSAALRALPDVADASCALDRDPAGDRLIGWVVPTSAALSRVADQLERELVQEWGEVFEATHADLRVDPNALFNPHGWESSYTGEKMPAEDVREQVDAVVEQVLSRRPRRVLEMGCGAGLLMLGLAPNCEAFVGTDIAPHLVRYATEVAAAAGLAEQVTVHRRAAHDLTGLGGDFDVVVLNSVVQYFPSARYLREVLRGALGLLAPGGQIFVGDVRDLRVLDAFHGSVELARARPDTPSGEVARRAMQRRADDHELALDPAWFWQLWDELPQVGGVSVHLKRGVRRNELVDFRYDVVLTAGAPTGRPAEIRWHDWAHVGDVSGLDALLRASQSGEAVGIRGVPDRRRAAHVHAARLLVDAPGPATSAEVLRAAEHAAAGAVHPEEVVTLGAAHGRDAALLCLPGAPPETFDTVLTAPGDELPLPVQVPLARPAAELATLPVLHKAARHVLPGLRAQLRARVPNHMVPDTLVLTAALPRNLVGKVDTAALPRHLRDAQRMAYRAPAGPTEKAVADMFQEVLRCESVGADDDLFALGGHSLMAIQLIARIRSRFRCEFPVRRLFDEPASVANVATLIEELTRTPSGPDAAPTRVRGPALLVADPAYVRPPDPPLSFAQHRILAEHDPTHPVYNIPFAFYLAGELDEGALRESLSAVVNRHDAWRTSFTPRKLPGSGLDFAAATQRIHRPDGFGLETLDLRGLDAGAQQWEASRIASQVAQERLDLQNGPLVRGVLMRLAEHRHALSLVAHHAISDGWSTNLWCNEFAALYPALQSGRWPALPELALQYPDFAAWERSCLLGALLEGEVAHWASVLAGSPELQLPTDGPYLDRQTYRGAGIAFTLDAVVSDAARRLSQEQGATVFMVLLSTWLMLLHRWCDQDDLVVGTPVAHRRHVELEHLLGCFINVVAVRAQVGAAGTFVDLLRAVREKTLSAFAHQDAPFGKIIDALIPERGARRPPVFQVMFELANAPGGTRLELPGLTLSELDFAHGTSEFELNLVLTNAHPGQGFGGWLIRRTDLFTEQTARWLVRSYEALLRAVVADPAAPVDRLCDAVTMLPGRARP